jgi:integrase
MAKPYLLVRPSGFYARYRVPADLRELVGSRFIVRPLYARTQAEAWLAAGSLGLLLSRAFQASRGGVMVEWSKLLGRKKKDAQDKPEAGKGWQSKHQPDPGYIDIPAFSLKFGQYGPEITTDGTDQDNAAALKALELMRQGGAIPAAAGLPSAPQAPATAKPSPLLSEATSAYLADLRSAVDRGELNDKTEMDSAHSLRLLAGVLDDDKPLDKIDASDMREFRDAAARWPTNAHKKRIYDGKTVREVLELALANGEPVPSPWTQEKHRQRAAAFFNHHVKAGVITANPIHGIAGWAKPDLDEDSGRPFAPEELAAIFQPERFQAWARKYPHRWFGVMLGLYSGARVNEIGQMEVSDVEQVDGVWGFKIKSDRSKGKRVKTKSSKRFVPLAQAVIDAGFLDYVAEAKAAGLAHLWPNLPYSKAKGYGYQLSRQFGAYLHDQAGVEETGSGFHYFRHTLASALDAAGVGLKTISAITGHKRDDSDSVLVDFYIKRTLPERQAALNLFRPGVELPAYRAGMFRGAWSRAEKKAEQKAQRPG